jgi:PAS domain S-box-containing protein
MKRNQERILFVDDQPEIIDLLKRQVGPRYDAVFAQSGPEALAALDSQGPFAVVVADYSMPTMDGIALLSEIKKRSPDTTLLMLTAFAELEIAVAALHQGSIFRFLRKPWERSELERSLGDAVAHNRLINSERCLREELATANTELDKKVKELDEVNQLLEYWVEFSPAVLYSADCEPTGPRFTYVSKNFVRLCGHERTALIVAPEFWTTLVAPDDAARVRQEVSEFVASRASEYSTIYHVMHRSGGSRRVLDNMRCVRNPQGKALEIVGAWIDLTNHGAPI